MAHPYQTYTTKQLQEEKENLEEKLMSAEQAGNSTQVKINRRKIEIVRSYMLDLDQFAAGQIYTLKTSPDELFRIDQMNGVMAWGNRLDKDNHAMTGATEALLVDYFGDRVDDGA